jgi:uncharacterized membrane protein
MRVDKLESLLAIESEQLLKLNQLVVEAVEEEKLISNKLVEFEEADLTLGHRVADLVARFGGSWMFIISFVSLMLIWIGANIFLFRRPFDPYPFILLNLILSTIAALQAPVILMSQNRSDEKDRKRAISDYLINLKAEIEIRNVHQKLDLLMAEQMKTLFELQTVQLDMIKEIKAALGTEKPERETA